MTRRGTTLLEMMVVGVLLMGLIGTIASFFTYMPRWFMTTQVRLDVNREESVASSFLERDLNAASACHCPSDNEVEVLKSAGTPVSVRYFLAANPTLPDSFELRRSTDGTTTNYLTVAREVSSLTCTARSQGVDICLVYKRNNATRRARLQWRATTPRTADLALGDWDANGRLDAAAISSGVAQVDILENQPEGTLTVTRTAALNPGTQPRAIVAADFNRDGRPDLAVLGASDLQLLESTNGFTFAVTSTIALPATTGAAHGLAAGDLDRDGVPDLVVSDKPGRRLMVLFGDGAMRFSAPVVWPAAPASLPGLPGRVRLADVNRDGILDVVVALTYPDGGTAVAVGLGLANRSTVFDAPLAIAAGEHAWDLDLGDLNRDGFLDLVTADTTQDRIARLAGQSVSPFFGPPSFTTTVSPTAVRVLDTGGVPDLAVAGGPRHGTATLSVFTGLSGTGPSVTTFPSTEQDPGALATGNVTRNARDSSVTHWMTPDPGGEHTVLSASQPTAGQIPYRDRALAVTAPNDVAIADFNRDGFPDVVFAQSNVLVLQHDTSSPTPSFSTTTVNTSGANDAVVVADVNRDGIPDVITAQSLTNRVCVLPGGSLGTPAFSPAGAGPKSLAAGDFDRDGIPDLVVTQSTNNLRFLKGDGAGGFTAGPNVPVGATPTALCVADFNRDGKLDVAVACTTSVRLLLGRGDGTFNAATIVSPAIGPLAIAAGDLNRDGFPDLVTADGAAGTLSVFLGGPSGAFSLLLIPLPLNGLTKSATCVRVADVDRDGFPDLVWCGHLTALLPPLAEARVGVCFNSQNTFASIRSWATAGATDNPVALATGDLNRDGRLDCVLSHGEVHLGY